MPLFKTCQTMCSVARLVLDRVSLWVTYPNEDSLRFVSRYGFFAGLFSGSYIPLGTGQPSIFSTRRRESHLDSESQNNPLGYRDAD